MEVGIEVRLINYRFRSIRKELKLTQIELADLCGAGISAEFISQIETLKLPSGGSRIAKIKEKFERIAHVMCADFDYIFPQDYLDAIQKKLLPRCKRSSFSYFFVKDVSLDSLPEYSELPFCIDSNLEELDVKAAVYETISDALTKKELLIISMRYGLYGKEKKTRKEIGRLFGVSDPRIRQIEEVALRKLRHPRYSIELRALVQ